MSDQSRPLGITVIALLSIIGAILGALSITIEFSEGLIDGIWNLIRTVINSFAGYSLWYMKRWVIPWVLIAYTFLLIGNGIMFLSYGIGNPQNIFSSVLIFGVMIYYIYTKSDMFEE